MKPRTKAPKAERLTQDLTGELAKYEQEGMPQHALGKKTVYRYLGVLLQYQQALGGRRLSLELSLQYLGHLRKEGFSESSIYVHRAVLQGFHRWRGESLVFAVRRPRKQPKYVEPKLVDKVLALSSSSPRDHLAILLMARAGLRRDEVVKLKVGHLGEKALRFAGKRGRERTVFMTADLKKALQPFCAGKSPSDYVVGLREKAIYMAVKRYGKMAGDPTLKPHDLRHYFCERLQAAGVPLRVIQELAGHESVETVQVYIGVIGDHLEQAIHKMEAASTDASLPNRAEESPPSFRLPMPLKQYVESVEENAEWAGSLPKKPLTNSIVSVGESFSQWDEPDGPPKKPLATVVVSVEEDFGQWDEAEGLPNDSPASIVVSVKERLG